MEDKSLEQAVNPIEQYDIENDVLLQFWKDTFRILDKFISDINDEEIIAEAHLDFTFQEEPYQQIENTEKQTGWLTIEIPANVPWDEFDVEEQEK